jgi:hypothetical protein
MHNTINVNGAQDPSVITREIERSLVQFVQGVRNQRRLHG